VCGTAPAYVVSQCTVYFATMQTNGSPALLSRIGRLLRAKQFLVFYAIPLFALSFAAPLVTGWLRWHKPVDVLVSTGNAILDDTVATRSVWVIVVTVLAMLLTAWFRCGYVRSLVGRLHLRPVDARQFWRMFGLTVVVEGLAAVFAAVILRIVGGPGVDPSDSAANWVSLVVLASVAANAVLLYADYAIVISDIGVARAIARSWNTVRHNIAVSGLVVLVPLMIGSLVGPLIGSVTGALATVLPTLLIFVLIWGTLTFVADVVLIAVYIDTIEREPALPSPPEL
jgi:hypothetical protein